MYDGRDKMKKFPCVLMRGGTSKAAFFLKDDMPKDEKDWEAFLLDAMGSPDPRQIDGLGGANSLTSKVAIIAKSDKEDVDVDYTFAQVSLTDRKVDFKGNCGNISSAVGPFALLKGLVQAEEGITKVNVYNTNTDKVIIADVPTENGTYNPDGDAAIAGVPGTASAIYLNFSHPEGSVTGKLLPTGNTKDVLKVSIGEVTVSLVDAANPLVFVKASDLGLTGKELPAEYSKEQLDLLEEIRAAAARLCGFVDENDKVSPAIPKMTLVAEAMDCVDIYGKTWNKDEMDLTVRMMSMQKPHQALAITGSVCITVAANVAGTVVADVVGQKESLIIAHPSGVVETSGVIEDGEIAGVSMLRTARMIFEGHVYTKQNY